MDARIIYKNGAFFCTKKNVNKRLRMRLEKAKFKFDFMNGWFTTNIKGAYLLRDLASEKVETILNKSFITYTPLKAAPLIIPKGLSLLEHQQPSVYYSLSRNRSYLALSPGLGKTIIAALIAKTFHEKSLVIVPPFLQLNTLEEFLKWSPELKTTILSNVDFEFPDVLIVPDSQIADVCLQRFIREFSPQLLIVDEFHRFKTETSKRSKAFYGFTDKRKRIGNRYSPGILDIKSIQKTVLMSGTPMPNRPIELYGLFNKCAGEYIDFMSKELYGKRYCSAYLEKNKWTGQPFGYNYNGCHKINFKHLMSKVKSKDAYDSKGFMLRLNKEILGLPLLTEEVVILSKDMTGVLKKLDAELVKEYKANDIIKYYLAEQNDIEDIHLMEYRRLLGEHKVKVACDYIKSILEDTDENILIVGYHKEVINEVSKKLKKYKHSVITGKTPVNKRQEIVKRFQKSKGERILLGNIDAIGVGFNITKPDRIILVEYDWSDSKNRQVIDRVHRYGLKHEVVAQYLAFRNSLDINILKLLLEKQQITNYV